MRNRDPGNPTFLIWAFLLFLPFNALADSPTVEDQVNGGSGDPDSH